MKWIDWITMDCSQIELIEWRYIIHELNWSNYYGLHMNWIDWRYIIHEMNWLNYYGLYMNWIELIKIDFKWNELIELLWIVHELNWMN